MKACPPNPGLTLMHSSTSAYRAASSSAATGVAGFSVTPARQPRSWMAWRVRCRCGQVSTCTVMLSAPAAANWSMWRSGCSIIRCTSAKPPRSWIRPVMSATIFGPKVITGTKWPSITSMWMTRAPASSTSPTCSRMRPKSADRIDGATSTEEGHSRMRWSG